MATKARVRQVEFWDSAPSELDRLTFFSRLEEKQQVARGWRRNIAYGAVAIVVLALLVLILKR